MLKKNKRYKRRAGLAPEKRNQVDNHLINIEFWVKKSFAIWYAQLYWRLHIEICLWTRFGTLGILRFGCDRCFKKIKPLRAVYGNIDDAKAYGVSVTQPFYVWRCGVWITHIGGYPGKYNPAIKGDGCKFTQLFICGHSHILKVMFDKKYDLLHMNPGACGKSGFHCSHHAALCDWRR
jgi:hypothetical protein